MFILLFFEHYHLVEHLIFFFFCAEVWNSVKLILISHRTLHSWLEWHSAYAFSIYEVISTF